MKDKPGINNSEFVITLDKKWWDSEDQFHQDCKTYRIIRKKLPRKLKKYYKKMGIIFIEEV